MAQVKILQPGNTNYDKQQNAEPPAGATTAHPLATQSVTPLPAANYSNEQQQK